MAAKYPDPNLPWPILREGVALIAEAEGCPLVAYQCQAGVWSIAYGETDGVHPGDTCTQEEADQMLCNDLIGRTQLVKNACTVEPSQHELAAIVSFAYNYGGWRKSTMLRAHNAGDKLAAARAFGLVNKFTNPKTGQLEVSRGLTARRARESALYLTPDGATQRSPVQAVEDAPSLAASPTMQTGTLVTSAGGAIAVATSALDPDTLTQWAAALERFGIKPLWALAAFLLGAGALILYRRVLQRNNGQA
jgi:lysozyme